jgi:hypothetical protein
MKRSSAREKAAVDKAFTASPSASFWDPAQRDSVVARWHFAQRGNPRAGMGFWEILLRGRGREV